MHKKLLSKAELWQNRSDSQNTEINLSWLKKHVVDFNHINLNASIWVFSHVPKTAGTSLESYLIQAFAFKDVLHVNAPDLNKLPQCVYLKNRFAKFISGHHPFHGLLYQLLPDENIVHISMMRDPVSRVVSYYNYLATRNYHALHSQIKDMGFDKFLAQNDMVEIHNGQAKRFAGLLHSSEIVSDSDLYFRAKQAIDKCYSLVGVTEFFKQFYQLLAKKCGITFHQLPVINRSETKVQLTDLSQYQLKTIKQNNKVDIQLYQYVKSKFLEALG